MENDPNCNFETIMGKISHHGCIWCFIGAKFLKKGLKIKKYV